MIGGPCLRPSNFTPLKGRFSAEIVPRNRGSFTAYSGAHPFGTRFEGLFFRR
jgi:hypothetical protein